VAPGAVVESTLSLLMDAAEQGDAPATNAPDGL